MDNTAFIQVKTTKSGSLVGTALDVSTVTGDYTVFVRVIDLKGTVRLHFADSLDNFTADNLPGPCFSMKGTLSKDATVTRSFLRRDFPSLRLGTALAKLRLDVSELTGDATKTVTYEAWIQYAS